jgi:aldehyde dehydrogenase (NAD+)
VCLGNYDDGCDQAWPLVGHSDTAKVAFRGSELAGQKIYESAARDFKHVSLVLDGKSPNIVFEDADLEAAAVGVIAGILAATGQTCIAGSCLLVHRSIHDQLVEKKVAIAREARIGDVHPVLVREQKRRRPRGA